MEKLTMRWGAKPVLNRIDLTIQPGERHPILRRLAENEIPRPWVGLAFGPGLAGEMIVIT